MSHNNSTGKQPNYTGKTQKFAHEVGEIAIEENESSFLDRVFNEGLYFFKQVADSEPSHRPEGNWKHKKISEIKGYFQHCE